MRSRIRWARCECSRRSASATSRSPTGAVSRGPRPPPTRRGAASRRSDGTWAARAPKATLAQVADHIEHIRDVAGVDAVGLGSDFDGITEVPVGLEDVSKFRDLIAELLRRGWSEQDVKKVAGLNALRVLRT